MKVLVARQSGLPVQEAQAEAFRKDWQSSFDELKTKHGTDMLGLQEDLKHLESELGSKYELISKFELPKSGKAWKKLVEEYGSILVSTHKDTDEVIMIVMDQGI